MERHIGGYFELELAPKQNDLLAGPDSFCLNSGRHALEFILRGIDKIDKIYLPLYTCDVVLEPIERLGIPYEHYAVNDRYEVNTELFEGLKQGEFVIVNNYFGIKDAYIDSLITENPGLAAHLIIDGAQSLFYDNERINYLFYSFPKYFGVPNGGMARIRKYQDRYKKVYNALSYDFTFDKFGHLLKRIDLGPQAGYDDFRRQITEMSTEKMKRMSRLTEAIIASISVADIKIQRRENYRTLEALVGKDNKIQHFLDENAVPLAYPFVSDKGIELRTYLIENKIYVPQYWPNAFVEYKEDKQCRNLTENVVFLPIDHRYSAEDMAVISDLIKTYIYE